MEHAGQERSFDPSGRSHLDLLGDLTGKKGVILERLQLAF